MSWEAVLKLNPLEAEANQRLGTIYQRLGDLDASDLALHRVLSSKGATRSQRAEAFSLIARNIKDRWRSSWKDLAEERAASAALQSPELLKAYERYKLGFQENLDSFYPGLNALSLLTLALELARKFPDVWKNRFDNDQQAEMELNSLEQQRRKLSGAVGIALDAAKQGLDAAKQGLQQTISHDPRWVEISAADYAFLTNDRPQRIAFAYQSALAGVPDFFFDSARSQLEIFHTLGVLTDRTEAALAVFGQPQAPPEPKLALGRVILFTGHMIDPPGMDPPRFPPSLRQAARAAIHDAVQQEIRRTVGAVVAIASAASGGDLLFHEVCEELGTEHRLYLPLPEDRFRNESVSPAGRRWEDQFDELVKKYPSPPCLAETTNLPLWLSVKKDYTSWQRANLWLIHEAIALNAKHFTLIALWDGVKTQGLGGTYHMRALAEQYGAALVTLYTTDLKSALVDG